MAIQYNISVLKELKEKGYNTTRIRREKILGESTVQKLREGRMVSLKNLERLCAILDCDIGYILTYKDEEKEDANENND